MHTTRRDPSSKLQFQKEEELWRQAFHHSHEFAGHEPKGLQFIPLSMRLSDALISLEGDGKLRLPYTG